jgi:hypothetical protein
MDNFIARNYAQILTCSANNCLSKNVTRFVAFITVGVLAMLDKINQFG